ncbi:MAG TPA: hypothetical protein VFG12_15210 [Rhodopila sp.]|jgi:8-oxo-dGTP pyrophosphatase MutT (NUDIX family)|nr:hypothetical protein [Rhodopila sp.]
MEAIARPAATIMLLRDGPDGIEVFMVVRNNAIAFAAGALVFPGGRVEAADHDLAAGCLDQAGLGPEGSGPAAPGFRVAAIRETFEECGVLLVRPAGSARLIDGATLRLVEARHRAALNAGSVGFGSVLAEEGLRPALDLLVHFAHWITPAHQPKRYDTHFFLAAAPAEHLAVHDGGEAVDSLWITPARALADTEAGRFKLVFATARNLAKLGRFATVQAALAACRGQRVVTVLPQGTRLADGRRLMRIPAEADYGGSEFVVTYEPAS